MRSRGRAGGSAPALLLGVSLLFWGTSFRATAIAAEHTSGVVISALRAVPAAIALAALVALLPGRRFPATPALWLWAGVTGLLGTTLFFVGLSEGTRLAGAGNAAVLANATPFFVLVLSWMFLRERASVAGVAGLGVGFAGVVVMVSSQFGGEHDTGDLLAGISLALAAAAGWAVTTLVVKWLVERHPDLDLVGLTAGQFLVGAAACVPLALGLEGTGGTDWGSGDLWGAIAWLTAGSSVLAYLAFFAALKRASATAVSASLFLVPVVAVLVEAVYGEAPGGVVLGGMALAILGVALVMFAPELEARRRSARAVAQGERATSR